MLCLKMNNWIGFATGPDMDNLDMVYVFERSVGNLVYPRRTPCVSTKRVSGTSFLP